MATHDTPHLCNEIGVEKIHIGVKEFRCIGARPPMSHPHVYLDMGANDQIVCPYCSTLYTYDPHIEPDQTDPPYCLYEDDTPSTR
ncbi:MAG: zinc-finger domain-containing protein [Alphaproteobacteria bacterium]